MVRRDLGQSTSEITLVVSVLALALVAASTVLIPVFSDGARELERSRSARPTVTEVGGIATATPDDVSGALAEHGGDTSSLEALTNAIGPPSNPGG